MHLPQAIKYFSIVEEDSKFAILNQVSNLVARDYAIQIEFVRVEYTDFMKLLKFENDRNFIIFLSFKDESFQTKAIKELHKVIENSCCYHKLCIFRNDDVNSLYQQMVGSLNLSYFFSSDGIIRTYGINCEKDVSEIRSTLINENYTLKTVEIANVRPIILDYSRCGVLEPSFYFFGIDFQTCIANVFDPDSMKWKTAYLIQCDDSGSSDIDMVKICFVNEPLLNENIPLLDISRGEEKWLMQAKSLARPESRFSKETVLNRSLRLETETKSGIVALPVLEPYLDVKWPKELPKKDFEYPHPEIAKYSFQLRKIENERLENKRFGM